MMRRHSGKNCLQRIGKISGRPGDSTFGVVAISDVEPVTKRVDRDLLITLSALQVMSSIQDAPSALGEYMLKGWVRLSCFPLRSLF